ncbi:hypothetical protein DFH07DRAFT_953867 [Mycena maculata]|uniref:Uncharacterized protein n=1 Tax=Mycena maculata TaxID=230809 RepID=A0AAD7JSG6_9AGAR|nr:hypothetical protein DFH07DRAFT_953867 [Mycena maculata]
MLWYPSLLRQTRSGREFSDLSLPTLITPLQAKDFDVSPLIARAVAAESGNQQDHEDDNASNASNFEEDALDEPSAAADPLDCVDETRPPSSPHDSWEDINDTIPSSCHHKRRRSRSASFSEVVASAEPPHAGPHRQRPAKLHRLTKKHASATQRRKSKRQKIKQASSHVPAASTIHKHVQPAIPLDTGLDTSTLPSAHGAYSAKLKGPAEERHGSKVRCSLANLLGLGFRLVEWDGITPQPLVDSQGRVIAVLAGQPRKDSYRDAVACAYRAICDACSEAQFPPSMRQHRRGLFAAINVGLSYGKGQTKPCWLHNKEYASVVDRLLANEDIGRLAGFADAAFTIWAPLLYAHYRQCNAKLREELPDLRRPFAHSVFFCSAFNFGPNVWTFKHRDVLNLAFGWCAVQALGHFDPKKGGHLVFWDLKLVVKFLAGALILLPSATIAHSNVPVQDGEERASFTQFSAGGIFRYVDNGCWTVDQLAEQDPEEYHRLMALKATRWEKGLDLFSTVDELLLSE